MGHIITIASSKGGAGKTALCMVLGANMAALGRRTAVVDADPNRSFSDWHAYNYDRTPFDCVAETRETAVVEQAQALAETHDTVLIDTAGFGNRTALMAMGTADLVLVPVMPDRHSVREAIRTAAEVAAVGKLARRVIPVRAVGSRWHKGGLAERAAVADLAAAGVTLARGTLPALSAMDKATFSGDVPLVGSVGAAVDRLLEEIGEGVG